MGRPWRLFGFDPCAHASAHREWVHAPCGATPEFCDIVHAQVFARWGEDRIPCAGNSVSKAQLVLELDDALRLLDQLFETVAVLTGRARSSLTLSARHINVYAPDGAPSPRPHKDRFASQVSGGVSIVVPQRSHLVLWPATERWVNPLQRAVLTESRGPSDTPGVTLVHGDPVIALDAAGDVQVFAGSSIWHTRRKPAGAAVGYFKCNDFGSDPFGDDSRSAPPRAETLRRSGDPALLMVSVAALARGFESVSPERAVGGETEWRSVHVTGAHR